MTGVCTSGFVRLLYLKAVSQSIVSNVAVAAATGSMLLLSWRSIPLSSAV
jgi:hypothetical protein